MRKPKKTEVPAVESQAAGWQFRADGQPTTLTETGEQINWTALEFVVHEKNSAWYVYLAAGALVFSGLVYLLTRDLVPAIVVLVVTVVFAVLSSREPRNLAYAIDNSGIHIGDRLYGYERFKSFSVVQEDSIRAVWLMPLQRFMPIIPIYYPEGDEQKIVGALALTLPLENREPDLIDKLMHRLRF